MDQYYHHHQPHNQWRQPPPPQQPNLCPVCSNPHFPFCPPYPPYHHQNPNYTQQPNYARPGYDPYQPPPPPPPAPAPPPPPPYINGFSDPRSWHPNPNSGYDHATTGGGDVDRSYKRPRIEEIGSAPARMLTEEERRLKLIRDHGAPSFSGFNQENKSLNNVNNNNNINLMPPRSSEMYNIEDSLNNYADYYGNNNYNQPQQIQHKDSVPTSVHHWQGYEQRSGGYFPHLGGNHMAQPPPPPLPASPSPPLPVEAYSSSPNSSFSLCPRGVRSSVTAHSTYPVVTEPYYQNKPPQHTSGGFHREVMACF